MSCLRVGGYEDRDNGVVRVNLRSAEFMGDPEQGWSTLHVLPSNDPKLSLRLTKDHTVECLVGKDKGKMVPMRHDYFRWMMDPN